jgi:hypothetical protein
MPLGPSQQYLVKYNNYVLPGYLQSESFESAMNIASHYGPYIDGSPSEETGLSNKVLNLTLKVWETDYLTCKQQIELAATYLRSYRSGFANLYVQYPDKHYAAMVKDIKVDKSVGSPRLLEYTVEFECKPWLMGEVLRTLTGTGTSDTDQVSRTIADGGWTPTIITVTGAAPVISGLTADGQSTGSIIVSGSVTNLIINTEAFTATMAAVNRNDLLTTKDYRMFVGPEKTTFTITGASSCSIAYYDRWYI